SVVYALKNPDSPLDFVREYAQEMSDEVMYKHIGLYVNDYSADLGEKGIKAIETLGQKALEMKLISSLNESLF
ncbi:MAG: MqnA/MqnD/SBP family protein, partial [Bacteroidota bacterium]|nr:MqnA/MqnD/SBP family protein [Bacteroidota bacterium]